MGMARAQAIVTRDRPPAADRHGDRTSRCTIQVVPARTHVRGPIARTAVEGTDAHSTHRPPSSIGSRVSSATNRPAPVDDQVSHHCSHEDHSNTGVGPRQQLKRRSKRRRKSDSSHSRSRAQLRRASDPREEEEDTRQRAEEHGGGVQGTTEHRNNTLALEARAHTRARIAATHSPMSQRQPHHHSSDESSKNHRRPRPGGQGSQGRLHYGRRHHRDRQERLRSRGSTAANTHGHESSKDSDQQDECSIHPVATGRTGAGIRRERSRRRPRSERGDTSRMRTQYVCSIRSRSRSRSRRRRRVTVTVVALAKVNGRVRERAKERQAALGMGLGAGLTGGDMVVADLHCVGLDIQPLLAADGQTGDVSGQSTARTTRRCRSRG